MNDQSPVKKSATILPEKSLTSYLRTRLQYVQKEHGLTHKQMATIAGYERTSWLRLINSDRDIGLDTLEKFILYFGYPTDFWLPPRNDLVPLEIKVPAPPECVCAGQAPATKQIVKKIGQLSAVEKYKLIELIGQDPEQLPLLVQLFSLIAPLGEFDKKRLVQAVATIVAEKKQPAPP